MHGTKNQKSCTSARTDLEYIEIPVTEGWIVPESCTNQAPWSGNGRNLRSITPGRRPPQFRKTGVWSSNGGSGSAHAVEATKLEKEKVEVTRFGGSCADLLQELFPLFSRPCRFVGEFVDSFRIKKLKKKEEKSENWCCWLLCESLQLRLRPKRS